MSRYSYAPKYAALLSHAQICRSIPARPTILSTLFSRFMLMSRDQLLCLLTILRVQPCYPCVPSPCDYTILSHTTHADTFIVRPFFVHPTHAHTIFAWPTPAISTLVKVIPFCSTRVCSTLALNMDTCLHCPREVTHLTLNSSLVSDKVSAFTRDNMSTW